MLTMTLSGPQTACKCWCYHRGTTPRLKPALPFDLKPNTWHTVQTTVSGTTLTASVDGTQIVQVDVSKAAVPIFASGGGGFREYASNSDFESAEFQNLSLVTSSGKSVFQNSLETANAVNYFNLEQGTNVLPF